MKKIFSKKYWTGLISLPIIAGGIALACADGWGPDYGVSNFTPEAFVDSAYQPFFYSDLFYYGINYDIEHNKRFNQSNVDEWTAWLENKVPAADVEYVLLYDSAVKLPSSKKVADFKAYVSLAKKCEAFALNDLDSWEEKKKVPFDAGKINAALLQQFNNAKDAFLKQRYWFQLVRSYFFNSAAQNVIDLFERNKDLFPKNKIYYRTLAYAAGAYYKQKNYSKANYYYSRVYDGCNELKIVAHYSFHPQEEKDWRATLALAQNKEEQITLWQMLGIFYDDEKRAINEIYKLDPKSEKLDLLLSRAVNKEEQIFHAWGQPGEKKPVNAELVSLTNKMAASPNTHKPYMWYVAAGYLAMLNKDFVKAQSQYALAEKILPKEKLLQMQLRLLKLINKVAAAKRADAKFENEMVPEISWLTGLNSDAYPTFRHDDAKVWLLKTMASHYRDQKELVKAECFQSNSNFYASNANVEAMKSFLDKPAKTPYEELCARLYIMKKSDLLEYQAIRLAFDDKLTEAIAKMEAGTEPNRELAGNPFNARIQDCHDCDHAAPQKIKYTRLSLLKKMKEMEDRVNANDDVYNNAMLLANAFYNLTHYGNARYFYESKVTGSGHYSPYSIDSAFMGFLTDMKPATKYYNKALQAAKTDEQKAKCHYMLAKCERNAWYNANVYNDMKNEYRSDGPDFKAWQGFKALKQYSNTQYYKDVIKECGYFRMYTSK